MTTLRNVHNTEGELPPPVPWLIWQSDKGRWWATRVEPYDPAAEKAGAWRTVDADDELRLFLAIADQESIAGVQKIIAMVRRQAELLEQTYPAWKIEPMCDAEGIPRGWKATRLVPLTHSEQVSGLISDIARDDVPDLVMALAVQDEIGHRTGYTIGRRNRSTISTP
ncbi:hypothetical protein Sme01_54510 [Sphaerisporangium melleum]|nr:hypothetical protein [Sphaerisporangium melleum]GII72975.1 hypothetical protein Sme01_54510 [Sphaerisporangium melleum]